jgi:hypothetical protein
MLSALPPKRKLGGEETPPNVSQRALNGELKKYS